jgi:polar amino acid transport system substrate-binding protein
MERMRNASRPWRLGLLWALAIAFAPAARAADLEAFTEDWPPYNFAQRGAVVGIATDLLREMCAQARLACEISIVPWARGYSRVLGTPNTLLYTTARTPERESAFLWIGPFLPRQTWIFERRSKPLQLQKLSDLNQFRVGVVRGDAAIEDLLREGVQRLQLEMVATEVINLRKLMAAHVDAITGTEVGVAWTLRGQGLNGDTVQKSLQLSAPGGYYFAVNPGTAPEVVQKLRDAFAKLQSQRRVEALTSRYLD